MLKRFGRLKLGLVVPIREKLRFIYTHTHLEVCKEFATSNAKVLETMFLVHIMA